MIAPPTFVVVARARTKAALAVKALIEALENTAHQSAASEQALKAALMLSGEALKEAFDIAEAYRKQASLN